jgi:two-component system, LuxR family, sensor kinase FixL
LTPALSQQPYQLIQNYLETSKTKIIGIGCKVKGKRKNGRSFPLELAVTEMRVNGQRKLLGIIKDLGVNRKKPPT